ncbi:MAG: c-type cytochrome [Rhodocyclales bacterium]|nr:c-type cytochrome [Rhodocyclales bacterium]
MFKCYEKAALVVALLFAQTAMAASFEGIGRAATPAEVQAWDIDVRPDFVGLPPGKGNAVLGAELWEAKCAMCHGTFGESNEIFTPLVGGTTEEDIRTGRVKALADGSVPQRTTLMKVPTVSTLWDFIHRAMPWTEPKSLTPDQVYSLVAYLLNLAGVVEEEFQLDQDSIRQVQERMPNRNGMTWKHGLWPWGPGVTQGGIGNGGIPDVKNVVCMKDCKKEVQIASRLPEYAWDAHGNLAEQNRSWGPILGKPISAAAQAEASTAAGRQKNMLELAKLKGCTACHGVDHAIVGPAYKDVAAKYKDRPDALAYLMAKIKNGGSGVWGEVPMPPHPALSDDELEGLAQWVISGGKVQ